MRNTTSTATQEVDGIVTQLRRLLAPGQVAELRLLGVRSGGRGRPHIESGYFDGDHLAELARTALDRTRDARGVYVTFNPLAPDLLARRANRVDYAEEGELSKDRDFAARRWLPVDVDPKRDPHVSATDGEKAEAAAVANAVRAFLRERGWPEPLLADSGNGYHLLYRVDLPADDSGRVKRVLAALAGRFDTARATIDQAMFNPSRMTKAFGTLARKGDDTPARPHRRARLLEEGGGTESVALVLLDALAAEAEGAGMGAAASAAGAKPQQAAPVKSAARVGGYDSRLVVDRWLTDRGVGFRRKADPAEGGRTVYVLKACPFDPSHADPDACVMQAADGQLSAKCLHSSCAARGWKDFKAAIGAPAAHHFDPPLSGPAAAPRPRPQPAPAPRPDAQPPEDGPSTGAQVIRAHFQELYRPVFKDGTAIHCADGAVVPMGEACALGDSELIARLARASDAPRYAGKNGQQGDVKTAGLPTFLRTWVKIAWGDLLRGLPIEDAADLGAAAPARDEFHRLVRDAMLSQLALGEIVGKTDRDRGPTQVERCSLIDWCAKFARGGPWKSIRSYRCWCKSERAEGGPVVLRVAVRHELFAQLKADRRLCEMGANAFTRRAQKYDVGRSSRADRPEGKSAVVLDQSFVDDLLAGHEIPTAESRSECSLFGSQ